MNRNLTLSSFLTTQIHKYVHTQQQSVHALQLFQCIVRRILLKLGIRKGKKRRKNIHLFAISISIRIRIARIITRLAIRITLVIAGVFNDWLFLDAARWCGAA